MPYSCCYWELFRQSFFIDDLTCESVEQFLNDVYNFVRDAMVFEDSSKHLVVYTDKCLLEVNEIWVYISCHSIVCSMIIHKNVLV